MELIGGKRKNSTDAECLHKLVRTGAVLERLEQNFQPEIAETSD